MLVVTAIAISFCWKWKSPDAHLVRHSVVCSGCQCPLAHCLISLSSNELWMMTIFQSLFLYVFRCWRRVVSRIVSYLRFVALRWREDAYDENNKNQFNYILGKNKTIFKSSFVAILSMFSSFSSPSYGLLKSFVWGAICYSFVSFDAIESFDKNGPKRAIFFLIFVINGCFCRVFHLLLGRWARR